METKGNKSSYEEIQRLFPDIDLSDMDNLDRHHYQKLFKNGVYLWGTGEIASKVTGDIKGLNVKAFVDNYPRTEFYVYEGKKLPVIVPSRIKEEKIFIVIVSNFFAEIKKQLETYGKKEYLDFIYYPYLYPRPSDLVKELLNAPTITDWKCANPYQTIRLETNGEVNFCVCPDWTQFLCGNAFLQSFSEIKESVITKLFRYSIQSGKYCFCKAHLCSGISNRIGKFNYEKAEDRNKNGNKMLKTAIASFDVACNLLCESCRIEHIYEENGKLDFLKNYFISEIMPYTENIFCAGSGEVFFSKYYQEIIKCKNSEGKGMIILSNGNLACKEKLMGILKHADENVAFTVSIDAANPETYQRLRKGGNFKKLIKNLSEMGELVKRGKTKALMLNFVISKRNYKEIMDFVELGRSVGATALHFTKILNWGTFTEEEFDDISMFDENNKPRNTELETEINKLHEIKDMKIFVLDAHGAMRYLFESVDKEI